MHPDFNAALDKALKLLSASDRFESEVRKALQAFDEEAADQVIAHLRSKGLINDRRAAESLLRARSGARAAGRARLAAELERRGATSSVVEGVLPDSEQDRVSIRELLARKFEPTGDRRKAGRFLFARGFAEEDIEPELEAYFEGGA